MKEHDNTWGASARADECGECARMRLASQRAALERATVAESALHSANIANAELLREVGGLRAEVATLRAQLAYASERIESAMRAPRGGGIK